MLQFRHVEQIRPMKHLTHIDSAVESPSNYHTFHFPP